MSAERNWVAQLNAFVRPAPVPSERCDLCGAMLAERHPHLVEPANGRMLCACTACALLFEHEANARFRRVPSKVSLLQDLVVSEEDWRDLGVPIDIAFLCESSVECRIVARYPGAAGTVEAYVEPQAWSRLLRMNPALTTLAPDIEALMVNRMHGAREYYRMPIDRCYSLAGLIRRHWRGLSGGLEVWREVEGYFDSLRTEVRAGANHA